MSDVSKQSGIPIVKGKKSSDPTLPRNLGIRLPSEAASNPITAKFSIKLRIHIRE